MATPASITKTQNMQNLLVTANLIQTVAYYQQKIDKSHRQLLLIERAHSGSPVGTQATAHLKKQNKLVQIATELKTRMMAHLATNEVNPELEKQFQQEIDLLNYMHFEVTKTYFSFINQNFEARVITLKRPIAA